MIEYETGVGSKSWLINMYQEQLDKFAKLGLGGETENGVRVTKDLINTTRKRLEELSVVYDTRLSSRALALRKLRRENKEKLLNGSTNGNGTTAAQSCKDNSNTGHERSKT